MSKILEALKQLNVEDNEQWTADGLPRTETVQKLAGDPTITRDQITLAAPAFNRKKLQLPEATPAPTPTPVAKADGSTELAGEPATKAVVTLQDELSLGGAADTDKSEPAPADRARANAHEALADVDEKIAEITAWLAKGKAALEEATKERDRLVLEIEGFKEPNNHSATIRAYLDSTTAARLERSQIAQQLKSFALTPKDLTGKSPLDQALSGRRKGK